MQVPIFTPGLHTPTACAEQRGGQLSGSHGILVSPRAGFLGRAVSRALGAAHAAQEKKRLHPSVVGT